MEILAGNMDPYFKRTGIKAQKKWEGTADGCDYQVWEIEQEDFKKLAATSDDSYKLEEWWRSAESSSMGEPTVEYIINGKKIKAWDGECREEYEEDCEGGRVYENLAEYLCYEIGASEPRNVVALAADLAAQNGMTMAELFKTYQG